MRIVSLVGMLACIMSFAIGSYFGLERAGIRNDIIATAFKETIREYLILEQAIRESLPAYHLAQATPHLPQSQMTIAIFRGRYNRWEDLARQIRDQIGNKTFAINGHSRKIYATIPSCALLDRSFNLIESLKKKGIIYL
jgi:hypothetical protein